MEEKKNTVTSCHNFVWKWVSEKERKRDSERARHRELQCVCARVCVEGQQEVKQFNRAVSAKRWSIKSSHRLDKIRPACYFIGERLSWGLMGRVCKLSVEKSKQMTIIQIPPKLFSSVHYYFATDKWNGSLAHGSIQHYGASFKSSIKF